MRIHSLSQTLVILVSLFLSLPTNSAHAEGWELMPENRHQLFETYGLFFDEQCTFVGYEQAHLWVAMGASLPVYGNVELEHKPEFAFHASANAALHYDNNFRFYTETIDARFGLDFDWEFNEKLRGSIGITHFSGHAADGMYTGDLYNSDGTLGGLFAPTLGQEFLMMRVVYDFDKTLRVGGNVNPVIRSAPTLEPVQFEEFADWMPWGAKDDPHVGTPFLSVGLQQWGPTLGEVPTFSSNTAAPSFSSANTVPAGYSNTLNVQAGLYYGNHMGAKFHQTMRLIVGFYTGADPRLKYFEFANSTVTMYYFGAMFNI